ncbi:MULTISPECIES: group II intron reverse transcriptase/maturase [unclassified Endozoicomonas]|uniref:group II intron reverse transcriptase/maturase n=1 Tax=unclassified Endozoicomonas TaxID=2644528 RepID=UPI003BAE31B7
MTDAKPFTISKRLVWQAWQKVKANKGAAGIDGQSLADFEANLSGNLYKLWNRMSSGSYFPPPVMRVDIDKKGGGTRPLGVPTVADRIAQTVVKLIVEPLVEPVFHENSYGYRPNRNAHQALAVARKRCWRRDWVIDLDIKGFFDNLDHELMMKAARRHIQEPWVLLYIKRWLEAPVDDGREQVKRMKGTPQGGVISPLLANLFMHYAFDLWLERNIRHVWFERYADDALIHCRTKQEAESVLEQVRQRLKDCGLTLHPEKTKLVYCMDEDRPEKHENTAFDFLSYTFRPRMARNRYGKFFVSFLPAISKASAQHIRDTIRELAVPTKRSLYSLDELAKLINPYVQGWINYYGKFYPSELKKVLNYVEETLVRWAMGKYKKLRGRKKRAAHCLGRVAKKAPWLMAHWRIGCVSAAG